LAEYPAVGTASRTFAKDEAPFQRQLLETRKTIIIDDAATDERLGVFRSQFLDWGFQSMVIIPLLAGGELLGSFSLEATTSARKFLPQEISLAESMANTIAVSIDNVRLFERTERNLKQANLLYKTTQALMQASSEAELFDMFVHQMAELGADSVSVSLFQEIHGQVNLVVKGFWSRYKTPTQQGDRYLLDDFALKPFVLQAESVIIQQVERDERLTDAARQYLVERDVHSLVLLPLRLEDIKGTVHLSYKRQQATFSKNQARFFESLVQQLSILWQNIRLLTSVQKQVKREQAIRELTGKIHAATDVDQILQTTIFELTKAFDVTSGKIRLKTDQEQSKLK
jgi:GAF domain-containing protein